MEQTLNRDVLAGARQAAFSCSPTTTSARTPPRLRRRLAQPLVPRPALTDLLRFDGSAWVGVTAAQVLVATRAFTLPTGLIGSQADAAAAPTAEADPDIHKNGASIGTITFVVAASTATFSFASEVSFAAGDRLTALAPGART